MQRRESKKLKHSKFDIQDIKGTSPKNLKEIKGLKRLNFFPNEPSMNEFYNKETHGGNINPVGYFKYDYIKFSNRVLQPEEKHRTKRYIVNYNLPFNFN